MSSRLIIAIDCDDVLVPSTHAIVDEYNRRYGTQVSYERSHETGNEEWGASRDQTKHRIHEIQLSEEYGAIEPFADAVDAVSRLAQQHELHLITARDGKLLDVTVTMIDKFFPNCFTSLEHVGFDGTKGDVCSRLNADALIDDNLKHLQHAQGCGVGTLLWFGGYPWNSGVDAPAGIVRSPDWDHARQYIEGLSCSYGGASG